MSALRGQRCPWPGSGKQTSCQPPRAPREPRWLDSERGDREQLAELESDQERFANGLTMYDPDLGQPA